MTAHPMTRHRETPHGDSTERQPRGEEGEVSDFPEIDRAIAALVDICPEHTVNGIARLDQDCGNCGSRQEAAGLYLLSLIEEVERSLKL